MTHERALNLYAYLKQQNVSLEARQAVLTALKIQHHIDLMPTIKPKPKTPSPNRFDINNYGASGSRTLNQTRQMQ